MQGNLTAIPTRFLDTLYGSPCAQEDNRSLHVNAILIHVCIRCAAMRTCVPELGCISATAAQQSAAADSLLAAGARLRSSSMVRSSLLPSACRRAASVCVSEPSRRAASVWAVVQADVSHAAESRASKTRLDSLAPPRQDTHRFQVCTRTHTHTHTHMCILRATQLTLPSPS